MVVEFPKLMLILPFDASTIAFNIILSICNVALIVTYIMCIATLLAKRLRGEKLPPSRFNLGRAGLFINIGALCWLTVLATFVRAIKQGGLWQCNANNAPGLLPFSAKSDASRHVRKLMSSANHVNL